MALPQLDEIWVECARALGLPVERGGDAYVHFDGQVLRVADQNALDEDDSLAQLVLHELCHLLVQGPAHRRSVDWGLDNTGRPDAAFDAIRERAAVRLQAALLGPHGLRPFLYPTTPERPFFEALPADPLSEPDDDGSVALARAAALRAGDPPFRDALAMALRRSAATLGLDTGS
jgi:hypothetical protein